MPRRIKRYVVVYCPKTHLWRIEKRFAQPMSLRLLWCGYPNRSMSEALAAKFNRADRYGRANENPI